LKARVILRADGNSEIGIGHLVRSIALLGMLKDDFKCVFATRFLNPFIENEIESNGGELYKLNETSNFHYNEFLSFIKPNDIVVLDNYFFNTEYQKEIKYRGCTLFCIDDIHDKHYVSDAVINHAPGISANQFSVENYTKLYLGMDYALLRKEFFNVTPRNRSSLTKVLLCMGGADSFNITSKLIPILQKYSTIEKIDIIIGSSYIHKNSLNQTIKNSPIEIKIFSNLSAKEMVDIMQANDFAILPASTVCLEALAVGIPFIVGYTVDNQKELYQTLTRLNKIPGVGDFTNCDSFPLEELGLLNKNFKPLSSKNLISIFKNYTG